jgi:hypothetical protein
LQKTLFAITVLYLYQLKSSLKKIAIVGPQNVQFLSRFARLFGKCSDMMLDKTRNKATKRIDRERVTLLHTKQKIECYWFFFWHFQASTASAFQCHVMFLQFCCKKQLQPRIQYRLIGETKNCAFNLKSIASGWKTIK